MPTKRQITRLNKQQDAELLEVSRRVSQARAKVAEQIRTISRRAQAARTAEERERLYAQIAKINEAMAADLDRWAEEMVDRTAPEWRRAALDEIKQQTGRDPGLAVRLDRTKAQEYLRLIHPDNSQHLAAVFTETMSRQDISNLRQAFTEVFRQAQFDNLTANELQKELQTRWSEIAGDVEFERFTDRAGKQWTNASYLQMLVRTTTARVAREGYIDTLIEHGDDLAQIRSVGDSCPTCLAWDGVIVSLSGKDERYPSYQQALDAGMYHPNCDCLLRRMDATVHKGEIEAATKAGPPDLSALGKEASPSEIKRSVNESLSKWKEGAGSAPTALPPQNSVAVDQVIKGQAGGFAFDDQIKKTPAGVTQIPNIQTELRESKTSAHYDYRKDAIFMPKDQSTWGGNPVVFHHEFGHNAHHKTGAIPIERGKPMDPGLLKAMDDDFSAWKKSAKAKHGDQWRSQFARKNSTKAMSDHLKEIGIESDYLKSSAEDRHRALGFFDTIGGLSGGNYGDGHPTSYYRHDSGKYGKMEVYANVYRAAVLDWQEYKAAFPLTDQWIRGSLKI